MRVYLWSIVDHDLVNVHLNVLMKMMIVDDNSIFVDNVVRNELTLDRKILDLIDVIVWENNYYYLNVDVYVFYSYVHNLSHWMRDHSFDHVNLYDEMNEMSGKMFHVLNGENFD